MIKTKKQMFIVIGVFALVLFLGGTTYAWFNYRRTSSEQQLIAGEIYMHFNEGTNQISLTNVFPETAEEARARNDNYITFSIDGLNTSNKTIYYEFILDHGDDKASPKTRYRDEDLRFDLEELDSNGNFVKYVLSDVGYDTLVNKRIWVDTIDASTTSEVVRIYKLRMWLSEDVIISDSDPNRTYTTNEYKNKYATIKLTVSGDFSRKRISNAYAMLEESANTIEQIDFSYNSSNTNGKGLYRLKGTENDKYPIYYYRGEINNNNVIFGDYCWQIVRTTETGGIKMIYNGKPEITSTGNDVLYNCGETRPAGNIGEIEKTIYLNNNSGYFYADDYEIIVEEGSDIKYKLKSSNNQLVQVPIIDGVTTEVDILTIAEKYPYTCRSSRENTLCTSLYKVDRPKSSVIAYAYESTPKSLIEKTRFSGDTPTSVSDSGYMYNRRQLLNTTSSETGSIYGKTIEWNGTNYLVVDDSVDVPATQQHLDDEHRYTCGKTGVTSCDTVRAYIYQYQSNANSRGYINLSNGETLDDFLYLMLGNGSPEIKNKYSEYNLNVYNSPIKKDIDSWFVKCLTNDININNSNYQEYIEDTTYCNDRSYKNVQNSQGYDTLQDSSFNMNGGLINNKLAYGSLNRFLNNWYSTNNVPSMTCPNETDQFNLHNAKARLDYPVGLLTLDEVVLAGENGNSEENLTYYLNIGENYWTMSPGIYFGGAYGAAVKSNGKVTMYSGNNVLGVRPVLSLKFGTEFEKDGDGTPTNPYVVKYN